jgi:hypothetical protein
MRPRTFVSQLTPEIRPNVLYSSLTIGFILTVLLSVKSLQYLPIARARYPFVNSLTKYVLDPALIQFFSLALLVYCAYIYFKHVSGIKGSRVAIFFLIFFPAVLLIEYVLESTILKPSFHYSRPADALPECAITSYLLKRFQVDTDEGISAPSGFIMRQTILLLFFLLLSHQKRWREVVSRRMSGALHFIQYFLFVLLALVRFYRGRHTLFDIGVGIGVAVIFYWVFVLSTVLVIKQSELDRQLIAEFTVPLGAYTIAMLFYAQETKFWLLVCGSTLVILGALYHFMERRSV